MSCFGSPESCFDVEVIASVDISFSVGKKKSSGLTMFFILLNFFFFGKKFSFLENH